MIHSERTSRVAYIVKPEGKTEKLNRLPFMTKSYNEAWLQSILENNPDLIPSSEFGEEYSNLVCIGTEIPVGSGENKGYIDNLYVTPSGAIVIVETKLFRNQESKRTVVAQIIEYAKELQKWNCEMLDKATEDYTYKTRGQAFRVIDLMADKGLLTFNDESKFTDKINGNLKSANMLLLIIGDGIRTGVEQMADFLSSITSMAFNLALVEMELYEKGEDVIVIPNIVNKTTVVDRYYNRQCPQPVRQQSNEQNQHYVSKPILTKKEFAGKFAENGGYEYDTVIEFILDLDAINGITVETRPTELQVRFASSSTATQVLITFSISLDKADIWIKPSTISEELEKHGISSQPYDDFLYFYKDYVDLDRCKTEPYIYEKGFYFALVNKVLDNTDEFIKACENFANAVAKELQ